ncbi:MAG: PAS domain S-box protein [Pirellulales bacterium]
MGLLSDRRSIGLVLGAASLAAVVLVIDLRLDLGLAGLLYVGAVLLALRLPWKNAAAAAAIGCSALVLIGFIVSISHGDPGEFPEALATRGLSLVAVWAAALVGVQRMQSSEALRQAQQELEQRVARRTAELANANERLQQQMAERERAEQAAREFEAMYDSLMETLPLNVFRKDLDGRVVLANKRCCETYAMPLKKLRGKTDFDLFPRELAEKYHRDDETVIASGKMLEDIEQHRRPDGEQLYVQVLKAPVRDAAGNIVGVQGMFWDVTARRRAEVSLLQERHLLRGLMDNVPDSMYFKDRNGRYLRINKALAAVFRLAEPSYAEGKTDFDFYSKDYALAAAADEKSVLQTGQGVVNKEQRYVAEDGTVRWLSTTKMPWHDKDGRIVGTVGISRDITDRKQAEEAIRQNAEQTRLIIDTANDAFVAMDDAGKIIDWNPRAEEVFGWKRAEALGRLLAKTIVPPRFRDAHTEGLATFLATGEGPVINKRLEIAAIRRDGSEFVVEFTVTPIRRGASWVFNAFLHDITSRKEHEQQLQRAKEAAEAASGAKSLFLANMSHEIRTPMNAILGMTDLVLGSDLTPLQRDYLAVVQESGESLLLIIDDILDFSKIEAGRLDLNAERFELAESIGDMMKLLALRAHSKGLELAFRVAPEVPPVVVGDRARLRQIIVNLAGNAVKFTDHGEIVLDVALDSDAGADQDAAGAIGKNEVIVRFSLKDTGMGIPDDDRERIFDAFEQADNTNTRKFGGAGLGLAISSRLVKLLGGRIWVDSEVGRGSTFHFTARFEKIRDNAPADEAPVGEAPVGDADRLKNRSVLIVDDNATTRRILDEALRHAGAATTVASGAYEAISMADKARRNGTPFDVVLADANMPHANGFMLYQQLGKSGHAPAFVMMLSSGDRLGDVARCESIGARYYLIKPVKQSELVATLAAATAGEVMPTRAGPAHLGVEPQTPETSAAQRSGSIPSVTRAALAQRREAPPQLRSLNILLAEDSLVNQKLATGLMHNHGHRVTVANNGQEALAAIERGDEFDLVLMDVQMPIQDGLSATKAIRQREKATGAHLPIIALTAHAMKGDRELCLSAGMDGYVTKPVRAGELFQAIESILGDRAAVLGEPTEFTELQSAPTSSANHEATTNMASEQRPKQATSASAANGTPLDLSVAIEAVQGDRSLLKELILAFLEECPGLIEDIRGAIERRDCDSLRLSAHRLKGSMRYFGATRAFDQAYILESLGREGDVNAADEPLAAVRQEIAGLQPALEAYVASLN